MEEGKSQENPQNPLPEGTTRKVTFATIPTSNSGQGNNNVMGIPQSQKKKDGSDDDSFECDSESSSDEAARKRHEEEIEQAKQQWQEVENQQKQAGQSLPTERGVGGTQIDYSTSITYFDALTYFQQEASKISAEIPQVHYSSKNCFCLEKTVQMCSQEAYAEAYKIAGMQFDDNNLTHVRLLTSLHIAMTGILTPPPRIGDHWMDIGFQTKDPISDLRASGLLGLLLPLGLFAKFKPFGARVLNVSRGDCPFPLMVILIVYVKETLDALQTTDILINSTSKEDAWHNILIYFTGLVATLLNEWVKNNLDFEHDYNTFNLIAIRGKSNIDSIMQAGLRAEKEEDSSMPALQREIEIPEP